MGNFTEIDRAFNTAVGPRLNNLATRVPFNTPQFQNEYNNIVNNELSKIRFGYMKEISNITGRNTICYISA